MNQSFLIKIFIGIFIGSSMLIPGVSGGTSAVILNVYDDMLYAVSDIFKYPKQSIKTLFPYALGGIIGVLIFAKAFFVMWQANLLYASFFFIGAVLGSVPSIYKKSKNKKLNFKNSAFILMGFLIVILIKYIPLSDSSNYNFFSILISSFLLAFALILPGISMSHMMLIIGIYKEVLTKITSFDIISLIPLCILTVVWSLIISKLLKNFMEKQTENTYLTILGFILGSIFSIFYKFPTTINEIITSLLFLILGFWLIMFVTYRKN